MKRHMVQMMVAARIFVIGLVLLTTVGSGLLIIGSSTPAERRVTLQIQIHADEWPPPGEDFVADIVLKSAPDGLQRYELIFNVDDVGARIEKIESRTIKLEHLQIVTQSDFSVWFKAVDLDGTIRPGTTDMVLATITLRMLKLGLANFSLEIPQAALVNDKGHEVNVNDVVVLPTIFVGP